MLWKELLYSTNFKIIFLILSMTLSIKKFPHFFRVTTFFLSLYIDSDSAMRLNSALHYFMWGWPIFEPRLTKNFNFLSLIICHQISFWGALVVTKKPEFWEQNYVWLLYYFNFERNYDVLKSKSTHAFYRTKI